MANLRKLSNQAKKNAPKYMGKIGVVQLSNYEVPEIKEVYNKEWITFGKNNDYFDRLIDLYTVSPTNSRCINGIIDMIYGRGIDALDSKDNPIGYANMKLLLKSREVKRLVNDYKLLGQGALQIIYNRTKTKIVKVLHFPMETLRAEKAEDGVIKAFYYHPKWSEIKQSDKPKRIPTFGNGNDKQLQELYVFKPYRSGFYYYSTVDYQGCLQYCKLEEEISNYHISNIENGLQPSLFVNFNNGIPDDDTQRVIEKKIQDKFGGSSNSGKAIIAFNDSAETKADITPIHLPDAHAQYQFLSDEAREKIMLGHGVVSPILLGIKDNTGFGNNAEELRTASVIMDNTVIRPFQQAILEGLTEIINFNGIYLSLYFITLQPIEFVSLDNISTKIKREEETGEKLSSQELTDFNDEEGDDMLNQLEGLGEVITSEWELVHSEEVKSGLEELKMDEIANPNKDSSQDGGIYKVRYAYMPQRNSEKSRKFCKHMETFTSKDVVFRKEDINMMSFRGVNKELGHKKQNYSLFKFKGGVNCHHYWEMRIYKKKVSEGNITDKDKAIEDGLKDPKNPNEVPIRPVDMPNRGRYPKNK